MSESSSSNSENMKRPNSRFSRVLFRSSFPIYIANNIPSCRLIQVKYGGETTSHFTLTYLQRPLEGAQPNILTITSSIDAKAAEDWPFMPLDLNEGLLRRMQEFIRPSLPDPHSILLEIYDFLYLIAKSPDSETTEYDAASGLRFHIFHVNRPFPLFRAHVHIDNTDLHVIVMAAGFSRSEFFSILDSLIPVQGSDEAFLRLLKESGIEL